MLPDRQREGMGWNPPLPLILGAWWHTSALEKQLRLREHIAYAEEKGVLPQVERFLRGLGEDEWAHLGEC
jgi:hypothetical protein